MGFLTDRALTVVGVISAVVLLSSLSYEYLFHEDEVVEFSINDSNIMNDIEQITAIGPRVSGSSQEVLAAEYISQRFTEMGLTDVKPEEY